MTKRIFIWAIINTTTTVFYSCKTYPCTKAGLSFGLISFSEAEADTIILRRYSKMGNFTVLKDSFLLHNQFTKRSDTLDLASSISYSNLESGYDYQLYFPGAAKLYLITEIQEEQKELKQAFFSSSKIGCENKMISLRINAQLLVPQKLNYFYLTK